jgi:hypothetical protein
MIDMDEIAKFNAERDAILLKGSLCDTPKCADGSPARGERADTAKYDDQWRQPPFHAEFARLGD